MTYLLFDVENRNVVRNGDFSATQATQESTLTDTVLTNKTVAMAIRQSKRSIGQDAMAANRDIDTIDPDILALGLVVGAELERVDSHEELFVRHGVVGLVEQTRRLVLHRLHLLLLLLGADLPLGLLELLAIHTGLDLSANRLQIDVTTCETQGRRHVSLGSDVDGLVELLGREGHLPPLRVNAIGCAQAGDELLDEVADGLCILV